MKLEFNFEEVAEAKESPVVFHVEKLEGKFRAAHERAVQCVKRFLVEEAAVLESIIEVDQLKVYEKFGETHLTPYCVKHLGLSEDVAAVFVRVARKSHNIPELKQAIADGDLCVNKAKTIASVITNENQSEWIEKAKTLSKNKLEKEVASASPLKEKSEKPRHIGNDRMQIVLNLSVEEYERRCRIKDRVSQSLGKPATDSDVEVEMMDLYEYHKDPVRKAERAENRKLKAEEKCKERDQSRDRSADSAAAKRQVMTEDSPDAVDPYADDHLARKSRRFKSMHPRDIGRRIPARVRHAVWLRDRGQCQARHEDGSVCLSIRWVHQHHIIPKWQGGADTVENITTLCSAHHRLWHKREGA
jgi:hypothetical protein